MSFGDVFSAIFPVFGGLANSAINASNQRDLAEDNYYYQRKLNRQQADLSYQNQSRILDQSLRDSDAYNRRYAHDQYRIFRDSLSNANMNPYIMSGAQAQTNQAQGQAGSGASSSSFAGTPQGDLGFAQGLGAVQQLQLSQAQEDKIRAETKKISGVDTLLTEAETKRLASQLGVDKATIEKLEKETLYLGRSDLSKKLGENPSVPDYVDYVVDKFPTVARDVAAGVALFALSKSVYGKVGSLLLRVFANSAGKLSSIDLKTTLDRIVKSSEFTNAVKPETLKDIREAINKHFS